MTTIPPGRRRSDAESPFPYPFRQLARLLLYVTGPLALYGRNVVLTARTSRTFTADDERAADPALLEYVAVGERALESAGFGAPHRIVHNNSPKVSGFASLLEHSTRGDLATLMGIRGTSTLIPPRLVSAITFTTEFGDGVVLATSNVMSVKRFPTRPRYEPVLFRDVHDPLELYRLHRCRVDERARRVPVRVRTRGATEEARLRYQDRESAEVFEHWVQCGYYRRAGDRLRPTMRGAACMTWRGLWPWRQRTERRVARDAAAVRARCDAAHAGGSARR